MTNEAFQRSLVIKAGNSHLVAAIFEKDKIIEKMRLDYSSGWNEIFSKRLQEINHIESALIGSVNTEIDLALQEILKHESIPFYEVLMNDLSISLDVDNPSEVGSDLIANAYGACKLFPNKDIIVVDMGTAMTFTVIDKNRRFLGAVIYPGLEMGAHALSSLTAKLPKVHVKKPLHVLGKNTEECIHSGLYYGMIGAVQKITFELKNEVFPGKPVYIIATGGITSQSNDISGYIPKTPVGLDLQRDLAYLAEAIEPDLTLIGLNEILKEYTMKQEKSDDS